MRDLSHLLADCIRAVRCSENIVKQTRDAIGDVHATVRQSRKTIEATKQRLRDSTTSASGGSASSTMGHPPDDQ